MDNSEVFQIENARLIFRNFSGNEVPPYNRQGDRNFAVILDNQIAKVMLADGWNVKYLESRDEGEEDTPFISVAVNFKNKPPHIVMITSSARTDLTEKTVDVLDWANIEKADLIARAYDWEINGKTGRRAYLKTMFVTIEEDALERKYAVTELER